MGCSACCANVWKHNYCHYCCYNSRLREELFSHSVFLSHRSSEVTSLCLVHNQHVGEDYLQFQGIQNMICWVMSLSLRSCSVTKRGHALTFCSNTQLLLMLAHKSCRVFVCQRTRRTRCEANRGSQQTHWHLNPLISRMLTQCARRSQQTGASQCGNQPWSLCGWS